MPRPTLQALSILLGFLVCASPVRADRFRVTTWNLNGLAAPGIQQAEPREVRDQRLREIAVTLGATAADVLLLQETPDLATTERLAAMLVRGPYRVLACSQFADGPEGGAQVAVLSRLPALNAGTERWRSPAATAAGSGFAFATVRIGDSSALLYSVRLPENPAGATADSDFQPAIEVREAAVRQLLDHVASAQPPIGGMRSPVVLGGDLNTSPDQSPFVAEQTLPLIEQAGFTNAYGSLRLPSRVTRPASGRRPDATFDYFFTRELAVAGGPWISPARSSDRLPVTVDIVLSAPAPPVPKVASAPPNPVGRQPGAHPVPSAAVVPQWFWLGLPAGLAVFASLAWWVRSSKRRRRGTRILPQSRSVASASASPFAGHRTQTISPHSISVAGTDTISSEAAYWQERALSAERRADAAVACARPTVAPHVAGLLKDEVVSHLLDQRTEATQNQEVGAAVLSNLEHKLATIQTQAERRLALYEERIAQLEAQLAAKEEVNRQLLGAKIEGARQALRWVKTDSAVADPRRLDEVDSRIRQAEEAMREAVSEAHAKSRNEPGVRFSVLMARRRGKPPAARGSEGE